MRLSFYIVLAFSFAVALTFSSCKRSESSKMVHSVDRLSSRKNASGTFTDSRDGQTYRWVKIGTQTWMAQNLNYKVKGAWCYNNSSANCSTYGRLYQWASLMGLNECFNHKQWHGADRANHQGICPSGWHVPTGAEWRMLTTYIGVNIARTELSSMSGWNDSPSVCNFWPCIRGTDRYGFKVLPAGTYDGTFYALGNYATFWSASDSSGGGFCWTFEHSLNDVKCGIGHKSNGYSLRCVQDN